MNSDNPISGNNAGANGANGAVAIRTDTAPLRQDVVLAVSQAKDHITEDINMLVAAAGNLGRAELTGAAQRVSAFLSQVSATACDVTQQGKVKAQFAAQKTDAYVKQNPWQSLAAALALGYVFARLTTRR